MHRRNSLTISVALAGLLTSVSTSAADLTMRFVYDGVPPEPKMVRVLQGQRPDESLLVNPENRGIANVIVLLARRQKDKLKSLDLTHKNRDVVLKAKNGRLDPHIVLMRPGDTLVFKNEGKVEYVPRFGFFANPPSGLLHPPGEPIRRLVSRPEPAPVSIDGVIHPWLKGWLVCVDHPFAAVSDKDGHLKIAGLPEGVDLEFRVYHQAALDFDSVLVDGKPVAWPRSRFSHQFSAGPNNLGTVSVRVRPPGS